MTQKLQRMTHNPTNPKNTPQKSRKLSPIFATIREVGLKVGKKMNTPPCPARVLPPSSMALPQSCFSYTTTQQLLFRLHHCAPPLASHCRPPPRTSSASTTAHLLIVVFCHCHQRCCRPSATNRSCLSVAPSSMSLQPLLSSTSSYCCC